MEIQIESKDMKGSLLLEPMLEFVQRDDGQLQINESLVQVNGDGCAKVLLTNVSGSTYKDNLSDWCSMLKQRVKRWPP